jgi:lysophospholipase L1-like esterase
VIFVAIEKLKYDLKSITNSDISENTVYPINIKGASNYNLLNRAEQVVPNITENKYTASGNLYSNNSYYISSKIPVKASTQYTMSCLVGSSVNYGSMYDKNDNYLANINDNSAHPVTTFTTTSTTAYIRINCYGVTRTATTISADAMIVEGDTLPAITVPYGVDLDWLKLNTSQLTLAGNRWLGKKANFLGDSITAGNQTAGTAFPTLVGQYLGLSVCRNYGISGTTVGTGTGENNPMVTRYTDMDDDADIVAFNGGLNDLPYINNLGTINDAVTTSFYGALNVLVDGLITKYPSALIFGMTTTPRESAGNVEGYAAAIQAVCAKFLIPCLDLYHISGMNPKNASMKAAYFGDGLHHSAAGKVRLANIIAGFIRTQ